MKYLGQIIHGKDLVNKEYVDNAVGSITANSLGAVPTSRKVNGKALSSDIVVYDYFGTCSEAAGTAAKTVTVDSSFVLVTGASVAVKFTNTNSVANPTLNVNSTGAKAIMRYGTTTASTSAASSWNAGAIVTFVYDGTYWVMTKWLNTT